MVDSETLNVMLLVTDVLDELTVPYVIGGSMASIIHGMIRTTMDADIVADLKSEQVGQFVASLRERFYVDETAVHQALNQHGSFNLKLANYAGIDLEAAYQEKMKQNIGRDWPSVKAD